MEHRFLSGKLGRIVIKFWNCFWLLILFLVVYDLITNKRQQNPWGIVLMSLGVLSLIKAKYRLIREKKYFTFWTKYLNEKEKNFYKIFLVLFYFGFVLTFY